MNRNCSISIWKAVQVHILLFLLGGVPALAQDDAYKKEFRVKENVMYITLSKNLPLAQLHSFIKTYNIQEVGLHSLFASGKKDSIQQSGWTLSDNGNVFSLNKAIGEGTAIKNAGDIKVFSPIPTPNNWRNVGDNRIVYGTNRFKEGEFKREGGVTYFFLKGYARAKRVRLAGNFTNWESGAFSMTKTSDGWIAPVKLPPGQYFYKFIINNGDWEVDPNNNLMEADGMGNTNSVYFVPNKVFLLEGYERANSVYLSGSFNNWSKQDLPLKKGRQGWLAEVYLEPGTHHFYYIVDGAIVKGEGKQEGAKEVKLGGTTTFLLKGYAKAREVCLAGNFNDWKERDIFLRRNATGWEVSYALGPGNYQYKFIVDGEWIVDPSNPTVITGEGGHSNSFLVVGGNYTFRLKGFAKAQNVHLAGEFSNWSPDGLSMKKEGDVWTYTIYLGRGKHLYKFIVDGKWIKDPSNPHWEDGDENSVLWIE